MTKKFTGLELVIFRKQTQGLTNSITPLKIIFYFF
jgi:hypothetical protein